MRDARNVVFETDDNSQVIAKYLDDRLKLGLFPHHLDGIQDILWRYIDNDVESYQLLSHQLEVPVVPVQVSIASFESVDLETIPESVL